MLAIVAALVASATAAAPARYDAVIRDAVADVRNVYPVPPALVAAIIEAESGWDARAVSRAGARGLMQLMPATATKVGVAPGRLFEPATNVLAGTRLLAVLLRHYRGDIVSSIVAYNAGPRRSGTVPENGETPRHVLRVLRRFDEYRSAGPPRS